MGGLAVGGAVASWFLLRDEKPAMTASPLIAPGFVGAQWKTSF
jgi:hypothetical protein